MGNATINGPWGFGALKVVFLVYGSREHKSLFQGSGEQAFSCRDSGSPAKIYINFKEKPPFSLILFLIFGLRAPPESPCQN